MEDMIMQSGMVELGLWEIFAQARQANATTFLATVIAVWIAVSYTHLTLPTKRIV